MRDAEMAQRTCIVTGKTFDDEASGYKWTYEGKWYYFADMAARNRFMGNPKQFLEGAAKVS
jgi:YHS domain-containing protein